MKKQIVFEEKEFNNLLIKFVDNFIEYSKKGYGVKLVCNENKKELENRNEITGSFLLPWENTFKSKE
jgi:hypothetical protein